MFSSYRRMAPCALAAVLACSLAGCESEVEVFDRDAVEDLPSGGIASTVLLNGEYRVQGEEDICQQQPAVIRLSHVAPGLSSVDKASTVQRDADEIFQEAGGAAAPCDTNEGDAQDVTEERFDLSVRFEKDFAGNQLPETVDSEVYSGRAHVTRTVVNSAGDIEITEFTLNGRTFKRGGS